MRITIISTDLDIGGAQTMLLMLLRCIDQTRFAPRVISLLPLGETGKQIEQLGIPVDTINMRSGFAVIQGVLRLRAKLRESRPDVVQTWMYHADLVGGIAARLAGVRHIVWGLRNSILAAGKSKWTTWLVVRLCALLSRSIPHRILCCSDVVREVHVSIGYPQDRMMVIPNGFDLERFAPDMSARANVRKELGVSADTLLVGLFGRFDPQKNHDGFLKAAAQVAQDMQDVHFLLAGPGVGRANKELMQMVRTTVPDHVHLLGPRSDMSCLMAALDVLVCASTYGEGFPNVLGEAMASGVPCVTTDVGDAARIVGNTGKVADPADSVGLAHAMKQLLTMPVADREELGNRARIRIAELYDINDIVHHYEDFYTGVTA